MEDDDVELVVTIDSDSEVEEVERRSREFRANADAEWVRSTSMALVVAGSLLGLWFGILLFAASPAEVLENPLFGDRDSEIVAGQVLFAVENNTTGGEDSEGVAIRLLELDGETVLRSSSNENSEYNTTTNRNGRFSFRDVPVQSLILEVTHPGYNTLLIKFNPGDESELSPTLSKGSGVIEEDLRYESYLGSAVLLATFISSITVISALLGLAGAAEIKRGKRYRRTQYLCGLALFSRGGIFIGPTLILAGMAMLAGTKKQFEDQAEDDD